MAQLEISLEIDVKTCAECIALLGVKCKIEMYLKKSLDCGYDNNNLKTNCRFKKFAGGLV